MRNLPFLCGSRRLPLAAGAGKARTLVTLLGLASILPWYLPAALADTLFVADSQAGSIYTFGLDGARTTFASGLNFPGDVAFDRSGSLYVSEFGTGTIYKYTSGGTRTVFASGLGAPNMIAVDPSGNVYAESNDSYNNGPVYKIRPDGTWSLLAQLGYYPHAMACDQSGNLFVASGASGDIYKFSPNGAQSVFASPPGFVEGVTFGPDGLLYEGNFSSDIRRFSLDGTQSTEVATGVVYPLSLAFDSKGDLFSAEGAKINEFVNTAGVLASTPVVFASGFQDANGIAFQPVPEPSAWTLLAIGAIFLLAKQSRCSRAPKTETGPRSPFARVAPSTSQRAKNQILMS